MSHALSSDEHTALDPVWSIDLATALGVGLEEVVQDGQIATITLCSTPLHRRAYWSFLETQHAGERTLFEAHPRAATLLAHLDGQTVGALALLPDSPLGLPLPEVFLPTLARLRSEGRQLALIDPLVIPAELPPRIAGLVLRGLLRLALLAARRLDGRSDVLVRCEPRYARFFAQALLFTVESDLPTTADAPAQTLLRLDLDLCPSEWLRLYGDGAWSPYGLYIRPTVQTARLIDWLRRRPPPSIQELVATWVNPCDDSPALDRASLVRLCRLYPGLSEHLIAAHRPDAQTARPERAAGTGPFPRIRTPLP